MAEQLARRAPHGDAPLVEDVDPVGPRSDGEVGSVAGATWRGTYQKAKTSEASMSAPLASATMR